MSSWWKWFVVATDWFSLSGQFASTESSWLILWKQQQHSLSMLSFPRNINRGNLDSSLWSVEPLQEPPAPADLLAGPEMHRSTVDQFFWMWSIQNQIQKREIRNSSDLSNIKFLLNITLKSNFSVGRISCGLEAAASEGERLLQWVLTLTMFIIRTDNVSGNNSWLWLVDCFAGDDSLTLAMALIPKL